MIFPVDHITRALRAAANGNEPVCLLCQRAVREGDGRIQLRGEAFVHRRCATYRMRNRRAGSSRLGYPG